MASISDKNLLTTAGTIATVEARHNTFVIGANAGNPVPAAFDTPLDFSQVISIASEFIVNCPPDNPPIPVQTLTSLDVIGSPTVQAGESVQISGNFTEPAFAVILFDGQNTPVQIQNGTFTIPSNITVDGEFYVIISSDGSVADGQIIAGPAVLLAESDKGGDGGQGGNQQGETQQGETQQQAAQQGGDQGQGQQVEDVPGGAAGK
jgi:hypothetical protein